MSECISGAVCGQADMYCLVILSVAVQAAERSMILLRFWCHLYRNWGRVI